MTTAQVATTPLLESAREPLRALWRECVAGGSAPARCTLFLAASCGSERAHVSVGHGDGFDAAWDAATAAFARLWQRKGRAPAWLRAEVAHGVRPTTWERLRTQLAATKRNYWRHGIAFDAGLSRALLPMECAGNALLYDGNAPVATPNGNNLRVYARRRFGRALDWPQAPDHPLWLFDTRAVFADGEGVHRIEHEGRHAGYRRIPDWGAERVLEAVRRGAGYLARQVQPGGRYHYGWFPCFDRAIPTYNALRHASSTYALLEAWELTGDPAHRAAAESALDCLCTRLIREAALPDGRAAAFLVDTGGEIKLGGNAVCLLALCKHAELTGDRGRLPLLEKLALGILHMQDPRDGSFVHVLHFPGLSVKERTRIIYYDGEAAFGLMRLYGLTGDPRWLEAVERAFGHFIAAEHWRAHDHWLGYCVDELTRHRPDPRYYRFALDNVRGHLDFVLERITTFPTLLELMMAARRTIDRLKADAAHAHLLEGFDLDRFQRALEFRARYLMSGFFWPEVAMFFRNPARILDGFFIRHHGFRVRIDDVEHYLSGLAAYWKHLRQHEEAAHPPEAAPRPVALPADLLGHANGELDEGLLRPVPGGRLHWRAARAWEAMRAAAWADGVLLEPMHWLDTYRPLVVQVRLFQWRYSSEPAGDAAPVSWNGSAWWLRPGSDVAAVPGSSEHGWGLAVDVAGVRRQERMAWLAAHAARFGWRWTIPSEPWHLCYVAGDRWPEAVVAHVRAEEAAEQTGPAEGWDAAALVAATGGQWVRPPPEGWRATGLCAWRPAMQPGQVAMVRLGEAGPGMGVAALARLPSPPAAAIADADPRGRVPPGMPVLRVRDCGAALLALGAHARARMRGRVIGVTGSAGKSTTVAMLAHALEAWGPANRTRHNANLPAGIAWNLASMDRSAAFTVLEMAVGRMGTSARLARPDVAVVTTVAAAHLEFHGSVDEVARRKSRIFSGMLPGSVAVLNRDIPQWRIFAQQAARYGLRTVFYGRHAEAALRLLGHDPESGTVHVRIPGGERRYRLGAPGEHMAFDSLACLGALLALDLPLEPALERLAGFQPLPGRGETFDTELDGKRLRVIDEACNANPASMGAALRLLSGAATPLADGRRVAVLGDMRELGRESDALHAGLAADVLAARPGLALLCGSRMLHLAAALDGKLPLRWFPDVDALQPRLPELLASGDVVLVKGSAATRLGEVVALLRRGGAA